MGFQIPIESFIFYAVIPFTLATVIAVLIILKIRRYYMSKYINEHLIISYLLKHHHAKVALTDSTGRVLYTSEAFDRSFNHNKDNKESIFSIENIISQQSKYNYHNILKYLHYNKKQVANFELQVNDGEFDRNQMLTVIPILNARQDTLGLINIFENPGNQNQIESNLGHIEKLTNIGQIAAGIAHEMNTPLGSIILSADLIKDSDTSLETINEATKIKNQASRCSKVVKQLLGYVGKDEGVKEKLNIITIIEKVKSLIEVESKKRNIDINITAPEEESLILCSENQIEQLFFNLFSNAFYAIKRNGKIIIQISHDALFNQIIVTLSDDGSGIPKENIARIFDPFFTTKSDMEGTGLGLALCNKIVFEHNGKIEVTSTSGKGTTFKLYFPMAE